MKKIIHKIAHILNLNYGVAYSFYEQDKLMMSFKCSTCGELSGIHPIDDVIDRELNLTPAPNWMGSKDMENTNSKNLNKLVCIGKDTYPVEGFIGKPIKTFVRRLLLTKKIVKYKTWLKNGGCEIRFNPHGH